MIEKCCICGSQTKFKYKMPYGEFMYIKGNEFQDIHICPNCGYIYAANPLSLEKTNEYYETTDRFGIKVSRMREYNKRSRRQSQFILDNTEPVKSVFELGATTGNGLNIYKEKGLKVYGTDLSLENVHFAKKEYNIDLLHGDFEDFCKINKDTFDLVILSNVLEHIINPFEVMERISSFNNRYAFIEVPNFDYKYADMPYGMFIPTHQSYFTLDSLKALMNKAGYRLQNANLLMYENSRPTSFNTPIMQTLWEKKSFDETKWNPAEIYSAVSSERHLDLYLESSRKILEKQAEIIDNIPDDLRLAVWCLSRNTALLFNSTNLGKKNIIKFYDKNKVFHHRKIMGKSVSPFSKEDLEENKIDAVLVSSFEHQPSIVKQIKDSGALCDIITLYK